MTKLEGAIFDIKLSTEIGVGALLTRALKNLYDAKKAPDAYDKYLFKQANIKLQEAIKEGFSDRKMSPEYLEMREKVSLNIVTFSCFKAHVQGKELSKNLFDEKGNLVSFGTFRKKSAPILKEYNVRYLKAEYYTAARGSIMARKWLDFEKDADLFPNLIYKPSSATTPREKHKALYGIIKPINDPFWDTYMPPNGWNCQCSVTNTDKAPNKIFEKISKAEREAVKPPEGVSGNPGKTKEVFTIENSYIKKTTPSKRRIVLREWANENLEGKHELKELGAEVNVTRKKIKTILQHGKDSDEWKIHKDFVFVDLKQIFSEGNLKPDGFLEEEKERPKYFGWHYFLYKKDGRDFVFNIVEQWINPDKKDLGTIFYLHKITKENIHKKNLKNGRLGNQYTVSHF